MGDKHMAKISLISSLENDFGDKALFCVDSLEPEHARFIVNENGVVVEDWNGHGYENKNIKDVLIDFEIDQVVGWCFESQGDISDGDECGLQVVFDDGSVIESNEEAAMKYAGLI
jgi:hypothetical protein